MVFLYKESHKLFFKYFVYFTIRFYRNCYIVLIYTNTLFIVLNLTLKNLKIKFYKTIFKFFKHTKYLLYTQT